MRAWEHGKQAPETSYLLYSIREMPLLTLKRKVLMSLDLISTNQNQRTVTVLLEYCNSGNTLTVNISNFSIGFPYIPNKQV